MACWQDGCLLRHTTLSEVSHPHGHVHFQEICAADLGVTVLLLWITRLMPPLSGGHLGALFPGGLVPHDIVESTSYPGDARYPWLFGGMK